jgi:WD40 repeat protein
VAFSPDGKTLASASNDQTIRLWDAATGTQQQTLAGHSDCVRAVAFSPDGKTLASTSDDGTIRLWDAATGTQQQTLAGHSNYVAAVAFSPDGKTLKTNWGLLSINLDPDISQNQRSADGIYFVNGGWITRDEKNILWLPYDYRALCVSVYEHTLVLGHASGQVTFFQFVSV